jgi:predicted NAD/FAD-binding protein
MLSLMEFNTQSIPASSSSMSGPILGFLTLLDEIGLAHQNTDMSFSVMSETTGIEYAGTNLSTLFAQRSRLFSPAYLRFLWDIVQFNKTAIKDLSEDRIDPSLTLQDYLTTMAFSELFHSHYLLPNGSSDLVVRSW